MFCNPAVRPTPNNFDKYFDASVNSKYLKRGYVASQDAQVLVEVNYRPTQSGYAEFKSNNSAFLDAAHDNSFRRRGFNTDIAPGGLDEAIKTQYVGPLSFFRNEANLTRYVMDVTTLGSTAANAIGPCAEDMGAPGFVGIAITGVIAGATTVDVQLVRHYEMIVDDNF